MASAMDRSSPYRRNAVRANPTPALCFRRSCYDWAAGVSTCPGHGARSRGRRQGARRQSAALPCAGRAGVGWGRGSRMRRSRMRRLRAVPFTDAPVSEAPFSEAPFSEAPFSVVGPFFGATTTGPPRARACRHGARGERDRPGHLRRQMCARLGGSGVAISGGECACGSAPSHEAWQRESVEGDLRARFRAASARSGRQRR